MSVADAKRLEHHSTHLILLVPNANPPLCRLVDLTKFEQPGSPAGASPQFLDELSTLGENSIAEFYQDRGFSTSTMLPAHFPLQATSLAHLAGADRDTNAQIVCALIHGDDRGPKRDAVLLNAAAALFVAGKTKSLMEGWDLAGELIDSGKARAKLEELQRP